MICGPTDVTLLSIYVPKSDREFIRSWAKQSGVSMSKAIEARARRKLFSDYKTETYLVEFNGMQSTAFTVEIPPPYSQVVERVCQVLDMTRQEVILDLIERQLTERFPVEVQPKKAKPKRDLRAPHKNA